MQKNDEVLIQLRDEMKELEIMEILRKVSGVQHRLLQISIGAGAKAAQPFMAALFQSTQNLEGAIYVLQQANMAGSPGLVGAREVPPSLIRQ
jgi:hypothetical protein